MEKTASHRERNLLERKKERYEDKERDCEITNERKQNEKTPSLGE
jgi:hypothetical protein